MAFNLEKSTVDNKYYRLVIDTNKYQQLVLMSIDDLIPREIHKHTDQFIRVEQGTLRVTLNDRDEYILKDGDSITVPSNTFHEVVNIGKGPVKLYTIYSPPHHPKNTAEMFRT